MASKFGYETTSQQKPAHIIVCGNEKGGSGKTTTSMHIAVALLKTGYRVATLDLDSRQRSFSRYIENRINWARSSSLNLEIPDHFEIVCSDFDSASEREAEDFNSFVNVFCDIERSHDFIVIDTPGSDNYLMRLAHSMANTLITPLNDSFVDFDVLGKVEARTHAIGEISHYATMVQNAKRQRHLVDDGVLDWIVVRNRISTLSSRNQINLFGAIQALSQQLGFRVADGISERVIFREFFPMGLTALDDLDHETLGTRPTVSHLAARQEIRHLLNALHLPVGETEKKRAEARRVWQVSAYKPQNMPDIFAD